MTKEHDAKAPTTKTTTFVVGRPRSTPVAAIAAAVVLGMYLLSPVVSGLRSDAPRTLGLVGALAGLVALFASFGVKRPKLPTVPGELRIANGKLHIDALAIPLEDIGEVEITARAEQTVLDIRFGDQARICCDTQKQAEDILTALGLDLHSEKVHLALPSAVATRVPAGSTTRQLFLIVGVLVAMGMLLGTSHASAAFAVMGLGLAIPGCLRALALTQPTRVWLRAETIEWKWMGLHRRARYADVTGWHLLDDPASEGERRIRLELRNGERILFAPRSARERELLVAAIEAHALEAPQLDHGSVLESVRRRGRTVESWLQSLRAAGSGAVAGIRTPAPDSEALERLAADPEARTVDRVAACVALREAGRSDSVERIRVASASSDPDRVRIALARVTTDASEDEIVQALEEASEEEMSRRRVAAEEADER